MKIILEEIEPDTGKIVKSRFNTVGYLPQDSLYHTGRTLFEEAATAFDDLNRLHERIEEIGLEIEVLTADGSGNKQELQCLVKEMGTAQSILEQREGYSIEIKVKQVLSGLGFHDRDLLRMTEEFSGGWQMRIALAKLLLREPTILMLDEPTNHMDIESLEWLEVYLDSYKGSLVLVSHDSRFLDNLIDKVIDISRGEAKEYSGNYSSYLIQRAEHHAVVEASLKNQQRAIDSTTRFIERFRYKSTKARQVQSRIKQLEKMDSLSVEKDERSIFLDFPEPPHASRVLMEIENLSKAYNNDFVLSNISLTIERTDRIAFIGSNGSGKSTLARIIAGVDSFQKGSRRLGNNATLSYYAQNTAEELDPRNTTLETLDAAAPLKSPGELRSLLGCFLFTGDDAFKPVSVLSGGEKSRLALAKMILRPANLLVMDEPTNHLDAQSKAILQGSLQRFQGAYVIVSHDRDFLAPLINKVAVLKGKNLVLYHGTVDEYLEKTSHEHNAAGVTQPLDRKTPDLSTNKEVKRREAELRQERYRLLKPLKESLEDTENRITVLEKRKGEVEKIFSDPDTYRNESLIQSLHIEYSEVKSALAYLYDIWTKVEEDIDKITNNS